MAGGVLRSCVRCARVVPGDRPKGGKVMSHQEALQLALATSEEELEDLREENEELKTKLEAMVRNPAVSLEKMKL